jgi:SAM-dependent methyltransferase
MGVHCTASPLRQTETVNSATFSADTPIAISYGSGLPTEAELRLCGDLSGGRRAIELGISAAANSLAFASSGAKSIAVDPRPEAIADLRSRATAQELNIECHTGDLADLGFATSGSVELVLAVHSINPTDDLGRLLRQVHRVLKPGAPFVVVTRHPFAGVIEDLRAGNSTQEPRPYGRSERSFEQWLTSLERANFRVDVLKELSTGASTPDVLLLRARKEGS